MWARQVCRPETPAGSSSASSTASALMESSWTVLQNWTLVKTHSTLSSTLGALGVMFPEPSMWTWSPQWSVSRPDYRFILIVLISIFFITVPVVLLYVSVSASPSTRVRQVTADGNTGIQATGAVVTPLPFIRCWLTFTEVHCVNTSKLQSALLDWF